MAPVALGEYLNTIRYHMRLGSKDETEIIDELTSHIDDRVRELKAEGLSEEEAVNTCLKLMGSAKKIARQLYEAHSQGTWEQTVLAATPHLLVALLFVLSWWSGLFALLAVTTTVFVFAIFGWWQKKPNWFFSWMSYLLLPVVMAGLLMFYLPRGWSWLGIVIYVPLVVALIYHITVQTILNDWLYSSLMLFPIPIVIAWIVAIGPEGKQGGLDLGYLKYFALPIGISFLVLALSVAIFIRLRQRWLKISFLLVTAILLLSLAAFYSKGGLGLPAFTILIVIVLALFVTPAILEHKIRNNRT